MKRTSPIARTNGIHKRIGWHTFRHSFDTLLIADGKDVETFQNHDITLAFVARCHRFLILSGF